MKSSVYRGEPCRTVKKHDYTPKKVEPCRTGQRCRTRITLAESNMNFSAKMIRTGNYKDPHRENRFEFQFTSFPVGVLVSFYSFHFPVRHRCPVRHPSTFSGVERWNLTVRLGSPLYIELFIRSSPAPPHTYKNAYPDADIMPYICV